MSFCARSASTVPSDDEQGRNPASPTWRGRHGDALKICRLATDKRYRGEGIGAMLVNMIIASYRNDSKAGCRFITVDAYAEALDFYYKQGFMPLSKEDEGADTRLLYFDLESVPHDGQNPINPIH